MIGYRRTANIRLTVQAAVGNSLAVTTTGPNGAVQALTVPVYHDDPFADPDRARAPAQAPPRAWVTTQWIDVRAGRRGSSLWQADVYTRVGPQGAPDGDPFGIVADDVADALEQTFAGARPDGTLRAWIHVQDYSNPAAPVPAGGCLFVQAPGVDAGWGVPVSRTPLAIEGGYRRISLRFAFRLVRDAQPRTEYRETVLP